MIDLVCLVADKSMGAAVDALFRRHEALGIGPITSEILVHPERDPGCFHHASQLLGGYTDSARHALVVLDRQWQGAPGEDAPDMERLLEESLAAVVPAGWARAVVIDPELEAWVFSDSPHVAGQLAWPESTQALRETLEEEGLWETGREKPGDPKRAVQWVLRRVGQPLSSSIFRGLASKVSLRRCRDRSFRRLLELVRGWFGNPQRTN